MADTEAALMVAGEGVSQEMYDKLKADYDLKTQDLADARARGDVYDARERSRIAAFQPGAKEFMVELMSDADPETRADIAPLETWSNEFANKADILGQVALARAFSRASGKFKRLREEASVNSTASATLGQTMKDLESMTGERDALKQRLDEVSALADERQVGLEKLQHELSRAGLMADKFNFSKLTSREKHPQLAEEKASQPEIKPEIKTETSVASKSAGITDTLLAEIFSHGNGTLRSFSSGTNHSLLGSASGTIDLAGLIRAA